MPVCRLRILIARPADLSRPARMGAKYLPSVKDQKAQQRFQEKQSQLAKLKKLARPSPAQKSKRK